MTTFTLKDIASQIGITPTDALDLVRQSGVTEFHWEGERFLARHSHDELDRLLKQSHRYDPTGELEFSATPQQMAAILVSEIEQVLSDDAVALANDNGPDDPNVRRSRRLLQMLAAA